jgi:hypothetical protein
MATGRPQSKLLAWRGKILAEWQVEQADITTLAESSMKKH